MGQSPTAIIVQWSPEAHAPPLRAAGLRLFCGFSGERYVHDVYLVPTNAIDRLPAEPSLTMPAEGWTHLGPLGAHRVENPPAYYDVQNQRVCAVVFIRRRPGSDTSSSVLSASLRYWVLKNLEVELEGTRYD